MYKHNKEQTGSERNLVTEQKDSRERQRATEGDNRLTREPNKNRPGITTPRHDRSQQHRKDKHDLKTTQNWAD